MMYQNLEQIKSQFQKWDVEIGDLVSWYDGPIEQIVFYKGKKYISVLFDLESTGGKSVFLIYDLSDEDWALVGTRNKISFHPENIVAYHEG